MSDNRDADRGEKISQTLTRFSVAALVSVILMMAYLFLSRWPTSWWTPFTDWFAIGTSVLIGSTLLSRLLNRASARTVSIVVFVPTMLAGLVYLSMLFVCGVFEDCL